MPPVVRGDVTRLVETRAPSILAIADGRFHEAMSVGHAELRNALDCGWQVWGLASIGAIRAYEMRALGMRGSGEVYETFLRSPNFEDDEVALLHGLDPPYRAGSEPLVHMRVALKTFVRHGLMDRADAAAVARSLKVLWYGERTLELFRGLVTARSPVRNRGRIGRACKRFDQFRIKQKDLTAFLAARPWCSSSNLSRLDLDPPTSEDR